MMSRKLKIWKMIFLLSLLPTIFHNGYAQNNSPTPQEIKAGKKAKKYFCRIERKRNRYSSEALPWLIHGDTEAIKKLGKDAIPMILELVQDKNRDTLVRGIIIQVVVNPAEDERSVEPMISIVVDRSESGWIRSEAAAVLGRLGDKRALGPLRETVRFNNFDDQLRKRIILALSTPGLADVSSIPFLIGLLESGNRELRHASAGVLGRIGNITGNRSMVDPLLKAMESDTYDSVQSAAMFSLAEMKEERSLIPIVTRLKNSDVYAAQALGVFGDQRTVPALIEALKYKKRSMAREAALALIKIKDERAKPPLKELLKYFEETKALTTKKFLENKMKEIGW